MFTIPLSEVLNLQRTTMGVMSAALAGDSAAQEEIEGVFAVVSNPKADKRSKTYATVSVFLLSDALDQLHLMHYQRMQAENAKAFVTEGVSVPEVAVAGKCEHGKDAVCQYCVKE